MRLHDEARCSQRVANLGLVPKAQRRVRGEHGAVRLDDERHPERDERRTDVEVHPCLDGAAPLLTVRGACASPPKRGG